MRIDHEARQHELTAFLTLTYRDSELLPGGTLSREHFPAFMKRLREHLFRELGYRHKVSYFYCGEYGERTRRPHYHAILFGYDFPDKQFYSKELQVSPTLDALWSHGDCKIGKVTFESAAYCARYVCTKLNAGGEFAYEHIDLETGEVLPVQPEFARMSLKPAIGKRWIERFCEDTYQDDKVIVRGREMKPPKFYDKELERRFPEAHEIIKEQRRIEAVRHRANSSPERLRVRETVKRAQIRNLTREFEE